MSCARPNTPRSDPHDWGQLANPLRDRLWTICQDFGLYAVSLYRDPGRQWDLRHERVPGRECDPAAKAVPATAVPATWNGHEWVGGSRHQHRQAGDVGGARLAEARRVCHLYGLVDAVPSEAWHYETHPTLAPVRQIRRYPGPTYETPNHEDDDMTPEQERLLRATAERVDVLYAQLIGTKEDAPPEALRQLLRSIAKDADDAAKQTRP